MNVSAKKLPAAPARPRRWMRWGDDVWGDESRVRAAALRAAAAATVAIALMWEREREWERPGRSEMETQHSIYMNEYANE